MRFHRVRSEVLDSAGGGVAVASGAPVRRITAHGRNRETVAAFAAAWMHRDLPTLKALSTPEITCRWIGFGGPAVTAHGMEEMLRIGAEFEQHHGVAERYSVVETMGGESHAAILWEPGSAGTAANHGARVAIYRLDRERVTSIAVYADRVD